MDGSNVNYIKLNARMYVCFGACHADSQLKYKVIKAWFRIR